MSNVIVLQVFLDYFNTASCPGFIKEIITDRTMNGKVYTCILKAALSTFTLWLPLLGNSSKCFYCCCM